MLNQRTLSSWPIRKKLLLFLMLVFLPASVIIVSSGLEQRRDEIAKAEKDALLLVQSLAAQQEQIVIGTRQMLSTLAQLPELQRLDSEACNELFSELHKRNPFYSTISAATPDGCLFAASAPFEPGSINLSDRKHFRDAIETGDFSVGEYIVGRLSNVPSINYAYPVLDANKDVVAVVIAGFRLNEFARFIMKANLPEGYAMAIADQKGMRLYRLPKSDAAAPGKPISWEGMGQASGDLDHGIFERTGEDGVERIYAFRQLCLKENSFPYLYIFVGLAKNQILQKANHEMLSNLSILGVVTLSAMVLAWIFGNCVLIRPVNRLVNAAQRFGRGEFGTRTKLPHTPDELGQLAKSFDDMASMLEMRSMERENAEKALNVAYAELEARVQERTAELSAANAALTAEITERRQAEEAIQALVEGLVGGIEEDFFDTLVSGMCEWLGCECAIVGEIVHDSAVKALSMQRDGSLVHGYSYELAGSLCGYVVTDGYCAYQEGVCELFPGDRNLALFGASGYVGTPIKDKNNKPIGVLCAVSRHSLRLPKRAHDVMYILAARASAEIVRRRVEEEKGRIEVQMRQAQKMEAIGTLAGGIAHDFNNILGIILGYAEITLLSTPPATSVHNNLQQVVKASRRAKDLVKQILTFSRQGEQERKPLPVNPIVKETLKLLRAVLPTSIEIRQSIEEPERGAFVVMADSTQIHQVLMNLCTNASYAMREKGGILEVRLCEVDFSRFDIARPADLNPGSYVRLSVGDTGPGMEQAVLERIFDPYFTTKGPGEGTGLGLAVVHGVVRSHGGAITACSQPGKGTEFHVYLPRMESKAAAEETESLPLPGGGETILFVDDEMMLAYVGTKILKSLGYEVVTRMGSIEALDVFRAQPHKFDLVITDMTMPEMSGLELAEEFLRIRPGMPIILCTGFSAVATPEKVKAAGIRGLLMKPLTMNEVAKKVREVLDEGRQMDHPA